MSKKDEQASIASAELLYKSVDQSVHMEEARGDSLAGYAGHLLTAVSIVSVVIATIALPLFSFFCRPAEKVCLVIAFLAISLTYGVGFILALCALSRRKYSALASPSEIRNALVVNGDEYPFSDQFKAAKYYAEGMSSYYVSKSRLNDGTVKCLRVASGFILAGSGILIISLILFSVLALCTIF